MQKKVLIIDDNLHYASLLSLFLQDHDYSAKIALDGPKGIEAISKEVFDVWVVDHWLFGDFNGIDLIRKARNLGFRTSALIITCLIPSEIEEQIKNLGVSAVLDKLIVGTPLFLNHLNKAITHTASDIF